MSHALKQMRPGDKVLISAEVVTQTDHGTTMLTDGVRRWEVTNSWGCDVDPEYHVTAEEIEEARANWEDMCEHFGISYIQLETRARRAFRRSSTHGKGFRVFIGSIVHNAIKGARQ